MNSRFSLRWDNYTTQLTDAFGSLLLEEDLVDVTLSCEGRKIKAHKMLLSACSPYFHDIFKDNPCQHPVIVFRNVQYVDLKAIVDFIYCGEVNVLQEQLESFLSTASILEVKGLTDQENESGVETMSGLTMVNVETLSEQRTIAAKKQVPRPSTTSSGRSSPVAKKRKTSVEKLSEEPLEEVTVKKEVEEDLVAREDDVEVDAEITDPLEDPNVSLQEGDFEPSKDDGCGSKSSSSQNSDLLQLKGNQELTWNVLWEVSKTSERLEVKMDRVLSMLEAQTVIQRGETNLSSLEDESLFNFPIKVENMDTFENTIKDPVNKHNMIKYLLPLNGRDVKGLVISLMKKMFRDEIGEVYSLTGKSAEGTVKKPFIRTQAFKLIYGFSSKVLKKLDAMLNKIKQVEEKMLELSEEKSDADTLQNIMDDVFPFKTKEDIEKFEIKCQNDPKYIDKCVDVLKTVGGRNAMDATVRILRRTMTNNLAEQYSLMGKKEKNSFKAASSFYKAIFFTVKQHVKDVTEREIDSVVARWLVQAKLRKNE